jgi:ADP-ribose pyrophosphatase YjhB (NUDIX family)
MQVATVTTDNGEVLHIQQADQKYKSCWIDVQGSNLMGNTC